ncbi:LppU/SCO3897 family protein [Mycobacterium sp. LTG2003]
MTTNQTPAPAKQRWWRSKKVRIALVVIGTALVLFAKFGLAEKREERRAASEAKQEITSFSVGDCVTISPGKPETGTDIQRSPCSTDPSYTVGAVMETDQPCANTNYIGYTWSVGDTDTVGRLCLVENLTVGHCYHPQPGTDLLEQLDCATTDDKAYKVVQKLDSDDAQACPPDTSAYNYPLPPRTYCLGSTH